MVPGGPTQLIGCRGDECGAGRGVVSGKKASVGVTLEQGLGGGVRWWRRADVPTLLTLQRCACGKSRQQLLAPRGCCCVRPSRPGGGRDRRSVLGLAWQVGLPSLCSVGLAAV